MMNWLFRRETLLLAVALLLAVGAGIGFYATQATVLTIAVAPRDGTEPELIRAFAQALHEGREPIRLKTVSYEDVTESAAALQDGRVDLAVVRPDVMLPRNGLTLAILRGQAMLVVSPEGSRINTFPDLARKRLGIPAHKQADFQLLKSILAYYGLALLTERPARPLAASEVLLVPVAQDDVPAAFRDKRIDAVVSIIAPSAPKAIGLVQAVQSLNRSGKVQFVALDDSDALIERFPRLQAVTVPGGLFSGHPKVPEDDLKTIGASYRLVARASLSRSLAAEVTQRLFELRTAIAESTEAADYVEAPAYETTAAATSARVPIHPGAIDYFEREQRGFVDRYGDLIYLAGFVLGGLGSAVAWLRQRMARLRREPVDEAIERLLAIVAEAPDAEAAALDGLLAEADALAAEVVRTSRAQETDGRTLSAVDLAMDAARSAIAARRRAIEGAGRSPERALPRLATRGTDRE
ncbi:TAXI family TRAP transporter solute-binding subunit [Methylobacterium sp. JK268]